MSMLQLSYTDKATLLTCPPKVCLPVRSSIRKE